MHERVARGEPRQWLLKQFTERPGEVIYLDDLATAQGLRLTHQILGEDFYERIAKLLKELAKQSRS